MANPQDVSQKNNLWKQKPDTTITSTPFSKSTEKKYIFSIGGKDYDVSQEQVSWMRDRYSKSFKDYYNNTPEDTQRSLSGAMPSSFEKSYGKTDFDKQLYKLGLPSLKYLGGMMDDYSKWYGDGQTYSFGKDMASSISDKFKSSWQYEYTIEDQKRKATGAMPLAIEKKYNDNKRDYELMQQGLPPESMLTDFVNSYNTVKNETALKGQLYNEATIKIMQAEVALGGYQKLSDEDRLKIFDEVYGQSQYDDLRHLWEKSPTVDETNPIDTLSEYDAKWSGMGKKKADTDEPSISWNDFIGGYEKRKSSVLVDKAAYQTAVTETQKKTTSSLTNKDEVRKYVENRSGDRPADIFADMYGAGLSIGRVREAKDYLWDKAKTKEEKDAIKSAFGQAADAYTNDALEKVAGFVSDIFSPEKQAERKAAREGKRSGDAAVKDGVVKQYDQGATSTIDADDAEKIFKSHLVYDEKGKPTKESIALATNMLYEAGATTSVVLEAGKRSGMKADNIFSKDYWEARDQEAIKRAQEQVNEGNILAGYMPEYSSRYDTEYFNDAFKSAVADRDVKQRKELIDAAYAANVESGNMTSADFYNAVRRAGWSDVIDPQKDAESYYTEVYAPKFEKNGEKLATWGSLSKDQQSAFIADFESGKASNPDVHKTAEEITKSAIARAFMKPFIDIQSGTFGLIDMATAKASGRTDLLDSTKLMNSMSASADGVTTNQSFGAQAAKLSSTVAGELIRMYTISQIGSGVLSMFSKGASAIAGAVSQTNAGNLLSQIAANATPAMTKGASALVKGTKWLISSSPFIATSMGSYYTEAVQSGANVDQAVLYGTVCGAMEGALEAVGTELWLGRMFGGQSVAKGIISAGKAAFKSGAILPKALMIRLVSSTLGNALEEGASYAVSIGMQKATYNKDAQFDWTEAGNQALMGGLIGLLGAGMNAGADTQSNILAEFMNSKAGQEWLADDKNNSAFTDMFVMSTIADTVPDQARSAMRMQENAKSVSDVSAMVRDIDQHSRQMDAGQKQYDIDIAKIDAELGKKSDAVNNLVLMLDQASADGSPAGMKKWSKIAEQLRVANAEYSVEFSQSEAKRTERTSAFTETQEQHKIAIAKAQESLKGVAVSITEAFDPQISQIRDLVRDKVVAVPNEIAQEILTKMNAAHAGKLLDYIQTKNDFYQRQYESVTGLQQTPTSPAQPATDAQTVQATTAQPTAETASTVAGMTSDMQNATTESAGNIKSEATPANPAETMGLSGISVGAMTSKKGLSDGQTAISQFYSNTLETMDTDQHTKDVRDALQAFDEAYSYDVVSEKESIAKAQEVLARGITPELISELRSKNTWTGVDVDVAMAIKDSYRRAGVETGDMNDYINWTLLIADRVGEGGRAIQALAKYTRDTKELAIAQMQRNVKKAEKTASKKTKEAIAKQTSEVAQVVDDAIKNSETPDALEQKAKKSVKPKTAKSIKDMFVQLQDGKIKRYAFDKGVQDSIKIENGLPTLSTADATRVMELLDLAEQQTDSYERRRYQSMAAQIIANTEPVTTSEKLRSLQRIEMLLNPKTMIKNIAANPIFMGAEWIKDAPATLVDKIVSNWTGERTTTVSIEKQKAWFDGAKRGTSEAIKDIKYGVNTGRSTGKYEMTGKDVWKSKWINSFDKAVGYGLNLGDRPFYEGAYDEFLMNEKLLGHDIESDEVQERVIGLALDRVFQAKPKFAEFVLKGRNFLDSSGFPIGTLALPFAQTPANLADKILDYSVGTVRALSQLGKSNKTGEFNQKLFVDRIGRSITGKGLMILGFSLAKAGIINLSGDDNKERQAMKNAGVTPYSVQLGDASVAINWAEPVGSIILMGAMLAKSGANGEALNVIDGGKMLINSFFDNSVLQNLTNLLSSSNGDVAGGLFNFLLGTTTQFMPSGISAIAKATDQYERDTYDPNKILQQGKKLMTYFPGLRQLLPFKYGTDGKPVESNYGGDFFGRVLNTMVNPALADKKSGDAVNDEIYRLYQGGYTDQLLPVAAKTLANTTLTASQRRELQQMLGEATYNAAQRIIESSSYQSLTDDEKVAALADAVDDAARDAKDAFKNKMGK